MSKYSRNIQYLLSIYSNFNSSKRIKGETTAERRGYWCFGNASVEVPSVINPLFYEAWEVARVKQVTDRTDDSWKKAFHSAVKNYQKNNIIPRHEVH